MHCCRHTFKCLFKSLTSWRPGEPAVPRGLWAFEQSDSPKSKEQHCTVRNGALALGWSECWSAPAALFYIVLLRCLIRIQNACLKRGWARALVDVLGGWSKYDELSLQGNPLSNSERLEIELVFPAYLLPTCCMWWLQELRCSVSTLCLPLSDGIWRHQSIAHQRKSKRGPVQL